MNTRLDILQCHKVYKNDIIPGPFLKIGSKIRKIRFLNKAQSNIFQKREDKNILPPTGKKTLRFLLH